MSDYATRWPNFCRDCSGYGVTKSSQSVPYGSTTASFDTVDPCESCTNEGRCPRCAKDGLTHEDRGDEETGNGPCKFCGWDYDFAGYEPPMPEGEE
jgi:DnaJ-class molecular chaperone